MTDTGFLISDIFFLANRITFLGAGVVRSDTGGDVAVTEAIFTLGFT